MEAVPGTGVTDRLGTTRSQQGMSLKDRVPVALFFQWIQLLNRQHCARVRWLAS
jgi:hypothetical protein